MSPLHRLFPVPTYIPVSSLSGKVSKKILNQFSRLPLSKSMIMILLL